MMQKSLVCVGVLPFDFRRYRRREPQGNPMYAKFDIGGGRSMAVISIPPAINPEIGESPLSDISGLHLHVGSRPDARGYAKAVMEASAEEIELARPQLYFAVSELVERMIHNLSFDMEKEVKKAKGPYGLVSAILKGVAADAGRILRECDRRPRSQSAASELAGVLGYLAEMDCVIAAVAELHDPSFGPLARKVSEAFSSFASEVDAFRKATQERYPKISTTVPSSGDARRAAAEALAGADFSMPRITKERMERIMSACGDRDLLWAISNGGKTRKDYLAKGWHRPLSEAEAEELRLSVAGILTEYDSVFNEPGFLAELRQAAVSLRFRGLSQIAFTEKESEGSIRHQRKGLYETKEEFGRRIQEEVRNLPKEKERFRGMAVGTLSAADMVGSFVSAVGQSLRPGSRSGGYIDFRIRDGALVGEFGADQAIVIYDDHIVRDGGRHEAAVYAVKMPLSALHDGVPPLEDVRERMFTSATNYHSVEECLGELDNATECGFFFDGFKVAGHNGYGLVSEWKSHIGNRVPVAEAAPAFA